MRARLAIKAAGTPVILREITLRAKPTALLQASPKATVPVLVLPCGEVLEESRDIMHWALACHAAPMMPAPMMPVHWQASESWVDRNDQHFKPCLDRYKYADRHPDHPADYYRAQGEVFLQQLEQQLQTHTAQEANPAPSYMFGSAPALADISLFPFVRQFAHVDTHWFEQAPYPHLRRWLNHWLASPAFAAIMQKYPAWQPGDPDTVF